jgi:hypothetical protein
MNLYTSAPLEFGFPQWFEDIYEEILEQTNFSDAGIDHQRHYKNIAFNQTYCAHGEGLDVLLDVCHKYGLKVHLNGASQHYPSRTFSIAIYRQQDEAQFHDYAFCYKDIGRFEQDENEQPIAMREESEWDK